MGKPCCKLGFSLQTVQTVAIWEANADWAHLTTWHETWKLIGNWESRCRATLSVALRALYFWERGSVRYYMPTNMWPRWKCGSCQMTHQPKFHEAGKTLIRTERVREGEGDRERVRKGRLGSNTKSPTLPVIFLCGASNSNCNEE